MEKKIDSEKLIESKLRDAVKSIGGVAVKMSPMGFTGMPDRLVLVPWGKVYFVELKSTGKKPTPRQLAVHKHLRSLGFKVDVIDTLEGLKIYLEEIGVC